MMADSVPTWIFDTLQRVVQYLAPCEDGRLIPPDILDSSLLSLELVYRELLVKDCLQCLEGNEREACELVRTAINSLRFIDEQSLSRPEGYLTPQIISCSAGGRIVGRPRFVIPQSQLVNLVESCFTVPQISRIVGVSQRTIHRRLVEYGISITEQYADLTDDELDDIVTGIQNDFPMCGNGQMKGHLLSRGIRVQQVRIRESQRRIDPQGTLLRHLHTINRRSYRVQAPRSLFHIDGNHKLIRYAEK